MMNMSDGSFPPSDDLKTARARLASAEASVASAKEDARAAKKRRKEAKDSARRARKHLRRAKKELDEARRVLVTAEQSHPRLVVPRQLKPIEPIKIRPRFAVSRLTIPAKRKARRRAMPTKKANGSAEIEKQIPQNDAKLRVESKPVVPPAPSQRPATLPPATPPPATPPDSANQSSDRAASA